MNAPTGPADQARAALRSALTTAMKSKDKVAAAVLRSALSAIDNAEAVPIESLPKAGAVENSAVGVGAAEAARRRLTTDDVERILRAEIDERLSAAKDMEATHPERAATLRREAQSLNESVRLA